MGHSSREQVEAEREVINVRPEMPAASSRMSKEAHAPHVDEVAQAQSSNWSPCSKVAKAGPISSNMEACSNIMKMRDEMGTHPLANQPWMANKVKDLVSERGGGVGNAIHSGKRGRPPDDSLQSSIDRSVCQIDTQKATMAEYLTIGQGKATVGITHSKGRRKRPIDRLVEGSVYFRHSKKGGNNEMKVVWIQR
jgi:hypothetical protein